MGERERTLQLETFSVRRGRLGRLPAVAGRGGDTPPHRYSWRAAGATRICSASPSLAEGGRLHVISLHTTLSR